MFRLKAKRLTKIIGTLDEDALMYEESILREMIESGMDIARIELLHHNYKAYSTLIERLYSVASSMNAIIAILLEVPANNRTVFVPSDYTVEKDKELTIAVGKRNNQEFKENEDEDEKMFISINVLGSEVNEGQTIIFGDEVSGEIISVSPEEIKVLIKNDGIIYNRSRVYINGSCKYAVNFSEIQQKHLDFIATTNVDFITFVFSKENFNEELSFIHNKLAGKEIKLLCKIEKQLENEYLYEFIEKTNGIVIARYPMGSEMPIERICTYQKEVITACRQRAKPVLVSGHVLGSLRSLPYPLRADACDVYNGVIDGIDGFILSSEILQEDNWRNTLEMLTNILATAESSIEYRSSFQKIWIASMKPSIAESIASSAIKTCIELEANYILCLAEHGRAPRLLSKYKPPVPIITISSLIKTVQQSLIHRGTVPILGENLDYKQALTSAVEMIRSNTDHNCIVVVATELMDSAKHFNEQMGVLTIEQ